MIVENFAKKSFLALKNPYHTVLKVNPMIIDDIYNYSKVYYVGYKNHNILCDEFKNRLHQKGFLNHTIDKMSYGGRALDLELVNPLTGKYMTGSSSGTALNVFYRINDIGVGTDGGGSVLGPAASLNLYGFISNKIEEEWVNKFYKESTDGIGFSPSIGYITRDLEPMLDIIGDTLELGNCNDYILKKVDIDTSLDRNTLIEYINKNVIKGQILESIEGPIDVEGFGDSVFGHFDEYTKEIQKKANKGLMRVVNMCNKTCLAIPLKELGMTKLLICDSNPDDIRNVLELAKTCKKEEDKLINNYFGNYRMYF